jgi:hypothetical protein
VLAGIFFILRPNFAKAAHAKKKVEEAYATWKAWYFQAVCSSRTVTPTDSSPPVPHPLIAPDMTTPAGITSWSATHTLPVSLEVVT